MNDVFNKINELRLEKSELCMLGQFCRAFLERDPVITEELFPYIKNSINNSDFKNKIMGLYTKSYESEKQQIIERIKDRSAHPGAIAFYAPQLDSVNKRLELKTFDSLLTYVEGELAEYPGILEVLANSYKNIHGSEDLDYISTNYKYYYIGSMLYNSFMSMKGRTEVLEQKCASIVYDEYENISVDLIKIDSQFSKYKLLSKNEYIRINNDKDSQTIVDSRIGKYFWIDIPRKLLLSIEDLIDKDLIANISFRVDYISEFIPAMEEMEFGSKLKFDVSDLPELSKFYSTEKYSNNLWVTHDKSKGSLTFEELVEDFEVFEVFDERIVTQVVHLEYQIENQEFFIGHLDHEFIVYTLEEYSEREANHEVKGHKKIKTFKVDDSKIPFTYKVNNEFFLCQVLDSYLKNKDLISEYFENITSASTATN
ncbi:hypothetical protein ACT3TJ_13805 [Halomonas sp. AOP30-A1-24]|uniref:hypothetical protein n=1 Tax=Halomonas sp. AOP30-A1-24 TaxID=3457698 RepID=UPI00403361E4